MATPRTRAYRRHQKRRAKKRARHVLTMYGALGAPWGKYSLDDVDKRLVGVAADNLKVCSCPMCCNPRRHGEPTMQEKRAPQIEEWQ